MIEWIQNFIRNYSNGMYFPHIQIKDIIEILIVTIIVYEIMLWIKNTKAWMLLRGMLMLGGIYSSGMAFSNEYDPVSGKRVN